MRTWTWRDWCLRLSISALGSVTACVAIRPSLWPFLLVQVLVFAGLSRAYLAQREQPPAPRRIPVYRAGAAPEGCCQICGQHDPDHLVQGWHETCVEWLGYPPFANGGITVAQASAAIGMMQQSR